MKIISLIIAVIFLTTISFADEIVNDTQSPNNVKYKKIEKNVTDKKTQRYLLDAINDEKVNSYMETVSTLDGLAYAAGMLGSITLLFGGLFWGLGEDKKEQQGGMITFFTGLGVTMTSWLYMGIAMHYEDKAIKRYNNLIDEKIKKSTPIQSLQFNKKSIYSDLTFNLGYTYHF